MITEQDVHLKIAEMLETEIRFASISDMNWEQKVLAAEYGVAGSTMRRALHVLQRKGFVTESQYGRWLISASRKGWDMNYDRDLSPSEKLTNFLERTFLEEHVELSVWSITTQSLYNFLIPIITDIRLGKRPRPKSITFRLMLPDFRVRHGVPFLISDPADERPQERLRGICQSFAIPLVSQIESLAKPGELRVKVLIKTSPQMPQTRIYLSDEESMIGQYVNRKNNVEFNGEPMLICDVLSTDMPLIYYSAETEQNEQNRRSFDSHWNEVASETSVLDI